MCPARFSLPDASYKLSTGLIKQIPRFADLSLTVYFYNDACLTLTAAYIVVKLWLLYIVRFRQRITWKPQFSIMSKIELT